MKLIFLLAAIALSNGAKLDKNYLPPNHARTSGGSGHFLQTPVNGPEYRGPNGFGRNGPAENGYTQNGNGFAQNGNGFAQNGNGFAQNGNGFAQNGNGFAQNGNGFGHNGPERAQAAFERNAAILRLDNNNDGETYSYAYETENGIQAEESGVATNGVEAQGGYSYTGDDGQVYSVRYTADQNGFVPQGDHLPTPPPVPEEILRALEQNARDEASGIYDDGSYNEAKYGDDSGYSSGNPNNGGNGYNQGSYNGDDDTVVTHSAQGPGFRGQGLNQAGGVQPNTGATVYLPPNSRAGHRNSGNGFGGRPRRPSYNARDGYQY